MARPSPPRFLNHGDIFELPVVLENRSDSTLSAAVAVRAANLEWESGQGLRVTLSSDQRVELRFRARATAPGEARIQVAAAGGRWADAAEVTLPVWTPATTEAFASYETLDSGAAGLVVAPPKNVLDAFGGLELTASATALEQLTDGLVYITT